MTETQDREKFRELISIYTRNDPDVVRLCEDFLDVAHVWDDIYDQDKEYTINDVNRAFCKALGVITINPVYQAHQKEFAILSLLTALTWQIANRFESGNADELIGSFVLRNTLMLVIYFAVIASGIKIGDIDWGIDIGEQFFKEMFSGFHDKYKVFLKEMKKK